MKLAWILLLAAPLMLGLRTSEAERIVRPLPAPGPLDNPLKGWCPYTIAGPISQPYSMVFLYVPWKQLEPEEGRYAFAEWEREAWQAPLAKGRHVVFRVYVDYPGRVSGLPYWLAAKGVKTTPYREEGGGRAPDYDDARMVTAMERLLAELGRRYDGNPRVAFVEMGMLGFWGEWHTYPRTELFASTSTQRRVLDAAHRAFPHKIIMTRYPSGYAGELPWMGFFDDMFPEDTDGPEAWKFLPRMRASGRTDNWERAAIGGEMVPGGAPKWLSSSYDDTLRRIESAHLTWIGPYGPAQERPSSAAFLANSQALVRRMGYAFRLKEIRLPDRLRRGERLSIAIQGENVGVAPFYYPWPVELGLLDTAGRVVETWPVSADIRTWLPGPFRLAAAPAVRATAGRYTLCLAIRDPWTGRPAIGFANALPRRSGWTPLTEITITKGNLKYGNRRLPRQ